MKEARSTTAFEVIEVSDLSSSLFVWGDPLIAEAKRRILQCDLLVVASPVYKASYTGLLKAFLDQFGRDELGALATVPVMLGAGSEHALAVELHLRPLLVEIGASCPTRGLYVLEDALDHLDDELDGWFELWGPCLQRAMTDNG